MSRVLLFHRDFVGYSGGHGKVRDYFSHAEAHPNWTPLIYLTPESVVDNPWRDIPGWTEAWEPEQANVLFLGGMDWQAYPHDDPQRPVINLIQHVRHADPSQALHAFLSRRAIRICVSAQAADAILETGRVNGPVRVIEAALNLPATPSETTRRHGIFIDAIKQPELGHALHEALFKFGRPATVNSERLPRTTYIERLGAAEIAILLPHRTEGFYLPALEAMALGCAVVVPDCVGNRAYLEPDDNALVPVPRIEALVQAVARLDDASLRQRLNAAGRATAARFSLAREREAFHAVLDDLDALWRI